MYKILTHIPTVGEAFSLRYELSAAEGLGEDVRPHDFCWAADYLDTTVVDFLRDPEVSDVDVATALGTWASSVDERHG